MTRENQPAALRAIYRVASLLTGAFIIFSLAGCSGGLSSMMEDIADVGSTQKTKPTLAFSPAAGVPQQYLAKVNEQYVAAAKAKGIELADMREAQYVIKPSFSAVAEGKKGVKLAYVIDVTDKMGAQVKRLEGEELVNDKHGGDVWVAISEEAMLRLTQKSVNELYAWIDNPTATPVVMASVAPITTPQAQPKAVKKVAAVKTPPATAPTLSAAVVTQTPASTATTPAKVELAAVVPLVSGAPGNGKTALSDAMKAALTQQGIKIASKSAHAYRIQGQVELSAPENGTQSVTIRWVVLDPAGKPMEKSIVQKNKVPEGSLDKDWGDVAKQAAGAAAQEVSKLLNGPASAQGDAGNNRTSG